jgi:large subunit ribosomal protein L6
MSRIGKKPILIPAGVEAKVEGNKVWVKGPKGEMTKEFLPEIKIELTGNEILLSPQPGKEGLKQVKSWWGLFRMLIANMVQGVSVGFEKKLEIEGIGFKSEVVGKQLVLNVGFSHPVKLDIPAGLQVGVEKNVITVSGIDKESVGQFAAVIKRVKPPEPYKGKGIRYAGEIIKRKVGKKLAATAGK